jgi:hypothetical protein
MNLLRQIDTSEEALRLDGAEKPTERAIAGLTNIPKTNVRRHPASLHDSSRAARTGAHTTRSAGSSRAS